MGSSSPSFGVKIPKIFEVATTQLYFAEPSKPSNPSEALSRGHVWSKFCSPPNVVVALKIFHL